METSTVARFAVFQMLSNPSMARRGRLRWLALVAFFSVARLLPAQDHTVLFNPSDPGVTRSLTNWGLDTCWPSYDNMRRGLIFMGSNNVNMVRVGYVVDAPLTNNDLSASQKAALQNHADLAAMAGPNARWDLNHASSVDPWYQSGAGTVYPDRWAAAMQACQRYYNKSFWMVEGFNEPDYGWGQGSQQNLYDIFGLLQASTNFAGAHLAGGSVLNNDVARSWYNEVASRVTIGTTHCLAGSASTYVSFLQAVAAGNARPFHPELHNVMEAIMGINYGLQGGIWWGTAERARGEFVKACQGKRLGYAEDLPKWTAAAVYRGPNGVVQAFVGASERMATTTSYRFFSKDRDVFYEGDGPRRDYLVTIPGGTGYATPDQRNAEKQAEQKLAPTVEVKDSRGTSSILNWTGTFLAGAGETLVLLYLLLASGDLFLQKLVHVMPTLHDKKRAVEISHEVQQGISNYLFSVSLINLGLGLLVGGGLYFLGVPNAAMWGTFVAALNFVPYFGPVAGVIVLGAVGLLTFDTLWQTLLPPGWYLLLHLLEANLITPVLLGRRFTLNPVVIFVSLIFWTWIWGVPGALLSVPILVSIKVICDRIPALSPVGELLTS
jgi:hypothetical protein